MQKFEHAFEGNGDSNSQAQNLNNKSSAQWDDETENFFGSVEDLKTGIQNIKDSVETNHRKQESVIQKLIDQDTNNYLEGQNAALKRYNRTNTFNIIQLIQKEKTYWA